MMKKLQTDGGAEVRRRFRPRLSKIRAAVVMMIWVGMLQIPAAMASAQNTVTIARADMSLREFFDEIRQQTGRIVAFSDDVVDGEARVSVEARGEELDTTLDRVLGRAGLAWRMTDDYILVYRAAQQQAPVRRTVTGRVTDGGGEPLAGATIILVGTTTGTVTDAEGNYSISVAGENPVLEASYVGYTTRQEAVGRRTSVDFTLAQDAVIGNVVVTGLFTRATDSFTGSTRTITGEQLRQANPTNVLSALSIVEPSFRMMENIQDGSNPNVIPEFQIRGTASLPAMNEEYQGHPNMPLFIMDGFEVSAEKVFDLDPNRVESSTLLKDAAATAMYGSRAANGVVVITTKRPATGRIYFTYNANLGVTWPDLTDYDLLDAREKVELERMTGYFDLTGVPMADKDIQQMYDYRMELLARGNDTYWLNKPLRNAFTHQHSASVEGGDGPLRFSIDLGYDVSAGVMKGSERERKSIGVTLQYNMGEKLSLRNQTTYGDVTADNSPYGQFSEYARLNPYYAIYDDNGDYLFWLDEQRRITNPLYNTTLNTVDRTRYNEWANNFEAMWWITPELNLRGTLAIMQRDDQSKVFKSARHTDFAHLVDNSRAGYYAATDGRAFSYDANVTLSYNKTFGKHFVNANAVVQFIENTSDGYAVTVEGFPDENLDNIGLGLDYPANSRPGSFDDISRMAGLVASANYAYDERWLADFSVRSDASSKFGTDRRWATFWSAGAGWNIHNEAFLRDSEVIDRLRLRVTYGRTGSQNFNPYQAMTTYSYNMVRRYNTGVGATMITMGNDQLRWEETATLNVGFDIDLLKNRFGLSFDIYNKETTNLLTDLTLPPSLGFPSYRANLGDVQNRGWELAARVTLLRREDAWVNLSLGAVRNRNKLLRLSDMLAAWNARVDDAEDGLSDDEFDGPTNRPRVRYAEGLSLSTIWGVPSLGINPTTGQEIFIAADGTITDKWLSANQRPIGVDEPDLEGNIGLNAGFKGLQLTAYFRYRVGGQTYNQTLVDRVENILNWHNTDRRVFEERWRQPGDVTFFKAISQSATTTQSTSRFVTDYNYLSLASLALSYDFDSRLTEKLGMQGLRVSFSMNDVMRVSNVKEERGIDYPFARNARLSLRVMF